MDNPAAAAFRENASRPSHFACDESRQRGLRDRVAHDDDARSVRHLGFLRCRRHGTRRPRRPPRACGATTRSRERGDEHDRQQAIAPTASQRGRAPVAAIPESTRALDREVQQHGCEEQRQAERYDDGFGVEDVQQRPVPQVRCRTTAGRAARSGGLDRARTREPHTCARGAHRRARRARLRCRSRRCRPRTRDSSSALQPGRGRRRPRPRPETHRPRPARPRTQHACSPERGRGAEQQAVRACVLRCPEFHGTALSDASRAMATADKQHAAALVATNAVQRPGARAGAGRAATATTRRTAPRPRGSRGAGAATVGRSDRR